MSTALAPGGNGTLMHSIYFKLFGNIKSPHEANDFARLELESLVGKVTPIENLAIELGSNPLKEFRNSTFADSEVMVADALTHEQAYGKTKGYRLRFRTIRDMSSWVKRLAYTREMFVYIEGGQKATLKRIFPDAIEGTNAQYVKGRKGCLFRLITHQYFLENSRYISKLSRNEEETVDNLDRLYSSLTSRFYRIPASATLKVGKRLEDYFAIREEPSLYLAHYMHPYKGKFHPKMIRALLNYINPQTEGKILDNFAGSGTLLVEANLLGLDAVGTEINPLSVLMCNVKCSSLTDIDDSQLKKHMAGFLSKLNRTDRSSGRPATIDDFDSDRCLNDAPSEWKKTLKELREWDKDGFGVALYLADALAAKKLALGVRDKNLREFYLLAISGAISEKARRRQASFDHILTDRLSDLYLRVFLFREMNRVLKINPGHGECYEADTRDLGTLALKDMDGCINSPPYSTALNYIQNDQPQLTILGLHQDLDLLRDQMIGFPGVNYDRKTLLLDIEKERPPFADLPPYAQTIVRKLAIGGRKDAASRSYKFFIDMKLTVNQMAKVLKKGAKYVTVIGNNNYKLNGENGEEEYDEESEDIEMDELEFDSKGYLNLPDYSDGYLEVKNDKVLIEMGKNAGFKLDRVIVRLLAKSSKGNIRYESVVILEKT